MKKKLTGLALFLICSLLLVPVAMADSYCPTASLTSSTSYNASNADGSSPYVPFTCYLNPTGNTALPGNLDFSNFTWSPNPAGPTPPAAPTPTVNPIPPNTAPPGFNGDEGFNFTANWSSANTYDINVGFTVTGINGALIDDVGLFFSAPGPYYGNEELVYTENVYDNDPNSPDHGQHFSITVYDPTTTDTLDELIASHFGGPVSSITITKDVQFTCANTVGGAPTACTSDAGAFLSGFGNVYSYSAVPEPRGTAILLGLVLLGGILVLRRRQAVQN